MKRRKPEAYSQPIFAIAREEINKWKPGFQGIALAVLFCFIHRITTGKTFEETFNTKHQPEPDYQI
jgi:hypothetical protein